MLITGIKNTEMHFKITEEKISRLVALVCHISMSRRLIPGKSLALARLVNSLVYFFSGWGFRA